ncbi:MAG: DUF192 domain-containing protein [Pseudomonadota bacterium]
MSKHRTLRSFIAWIGVASGTLAAQSPPERPIAFDVLRDFFPPAYVIVEATSSCLVLDALLADTRQRQSRGLMFINRMPDNAAMLFDYREPRPVSMWMKNTLLPLDIAFLDGAGEIINIARNTVPLSRRSIAAEAPATYVLELPAGKADAYALQTGSTVHVLGLPR